jgi:hypothetical protein
MGGVDNKGLSLVMAFSCSTARALARLRRRRRLVDVAIAALEACGSMDVHAVAAGATVQLEKLGAREARRLASRCQRSAVEGAARPTLPLTLPA